MFYEIYESEVSKFVGCPAEIFPTRPCRVATVDRTAETIRKSRRTQRFGARCVSGIGIVIEERSRESRFFFVKFHVISKSMSVSVVVGTCCTSIVSSMALGWRLPPTSDHGMASPRCHPKFQEARFKKPVPQGELKRLHRSCGAMRSRAETCGARNALRIIQIPWFFLLTF